MRIKLVFLISLFIILSTCPSFSKDSVLNNNIYTKEKPLVYEDAYNLWPYSFLNDKGEPSGFNVDLTKALLEELNIPYVIRLKHPSEVLDDIKSGEADLTLEVYSQYNMQYGYFGNSVISLITHSIASPKSQPTTIKRFNDLANNKITVKENSICHFNMIQAGIEENANAQEDVIEAIMHVSYNDSGMVLWNTMALKYIINKYHLDNLQITPIQMDNDEYRFLSNDTVLLERLDNMFLAMTANEKIQPIRNNWFYPEAKSSGIPVYVWYIIAVLVAIMFVALVNIFIYRIKLKRINRQTIRQNKLLSLYMYSGHVQAMTYDITKKTFQTYSNEGFKKNELSHEDLAPYLYPEEFMKLEKAISKIKNQELDSDNMQIRGHRPDAPETDNYFDINISVLHSDNGKPAVLLITLVNFTDERKATLKANDLLKRYHSIFNTTMADMFYFNSEGRLTEINDKACETLGIKDKKALLDDDIRLDHFTIPALDKSYINDDASWVTVLYDLNAIPDSYRIKKHISRKGRIYYESKSLKLYDDNGNVLCTLINGIDVTDTTLTIKQRKQQAEIIESATKRINDYVENINDALSVSNIMMVNYYPDKKTLTLKQNLNQKEKELSQLRCLELLDDSERKDVSMLIKAMDKRRMGMLTKKVKTIFKDNKGRDMYLSLNFVPIYKDNVIDHYFGLCRDISELTETETKLKQEKEKAQETELLKSAFMGNMSHDIRTPLNSIVGFAELFGSEHTMEDEIVFVDEIKKNTNILLRLINDILFLSRIDANMIDVKLSPTEVSTIFKSHCSFGWGKVPTCKAQTIIECPDNCLLLNIDSSHFSQIIDILSENSAFYCKEGTISARCEFAFNKLIITFADNGVGIDEESLRNLFDRVVETDNIDHCKTKLGLIICKSLVELMGGELTVTSELGKGSTIRISIPCSKVSLEDSASILK